MINSNKDIFKKLCIISAPSGAGKTSLIKSICAHTNIVVCVSETTRNPRKGEVNGVDYIFIEKNNFLSKIKNSQYLEHALVHDNFYGTSVDSVMKLLETNSVVILEIDYQGAKIIKKKFPLSRNIFILPPSLAILENRLRKRGTDQENVILRRLENAKIEISNAMFYDYVLINNDFDIAAKQLLSYILDVNMVLKDKIHKESLIESVF